MHGIVMAPEDTAAEFAYPTPAIFHKFNPVEFLQDPSAGYLFHEDFAHFPCPATNATGSSKGWRHFLSDGGTILDGGIANLSSVQITVNDDNEAVVLTSVTAGIRITSNSGRPVGFECRLKVDTITDTKNGLFVGLWEALEPTATSHIADDGTLADKNFIGFHRLEGDGDKLDIVYKADGQTQQSFTDAVTLVADNWVKVGFYFDGKVTLKFYVDGAEYLTARLDQTDLDAATFPDDINLAPCIVGCKAATGTAEGSNFFNWLRFGYRRASADAFA